MGLQGCSTCCQLSACANHEGDEAKAGGAQEFKEWATLKRQLTPPVGPLSCCAQGLGRSGRDHLKLLGLADLSMQVMWPKRKAVPSSCWPGSWKEQVKSCTVHPAAGSTQKRGSGVGHQIKVFAFITSPPYRFTEDPHRQAAAGGYSHQQQAFAGVVGEISSQCFLFISTLLEILGQEQWQQTCTGHPSSPRFGMHF